MVTAATVAGYSDPHDRAPAATASSSPPLLLMADSFDCPSRTARQAGGLHPSSLSSAHLWRLATFSDISNLPPLYLELANLSSSYVKRTIDASSASGTPMLSSKIFSTPTSSSSHYKRGYFITRFELLKVTVETSKGKSPPCSPPVLDNGAPIPNPKMTAASLPRATFSAVVTISPASPTTVGVMILLHGVLPSPPSPFLSSSFPHRFSHGRCRRRFSRRRCPHRRRQRL